MRAPSRKTLQLSWILLVALGASRIAMPDPGEAIVPTLLEEHCLDCHEGSRAKGDVDLASMLERARGIGGKSEPSLSPDDAGRWVRVIEALQADIMPPVGKERPESRERTRGVSELQGWLRRSGEAGWYFQKLELPGFGNHVDHESLFSGEIQTPPFSPPRLWRLSPYIFEAKRRVGRGKGVQNPFSFATPSSGLRDYSVTSRVDASTVDTIILNSRTELEVLFREAEASRAQPPGKRRRTNPFEPFLDGSQELTEERMLAPIVSTFRRLVSREPSEEERTKYLDFLKRNLIDSGDRRASLEITLRAIYLSPEAIYRTEWGLGPEDEHGRRLLSPDELAYSLSYALFDSGPFDGARDGARKIGEAHAAGKLSTREDVRRVLTEILGTESYPPIGGRARDPLPRVLRFFREFFGYHRAGDVFKDADRVASQDLHHEPRRLMQDAENLVKVILREDRHVFEELLTTNRALVHHQGDNEALVRQHELRLAQLKSFDAEALRKQVERQKAGVLKKPKYRNNPDLVPAKFAEIDRNAKTALADARREYEKLLENGVSLRVNKARDRGYVRAYNLDFRTWKWPAVQPFELPRKERAGILTHPAWLVAHSFNDGNDPVHRGIWVYSRLLAGVVPDLPPDVDARVPENPHETLRERLEVLRQKRCWGCHRKFNPLGEAFESYDDFGRFRELHHFDEEGRLVTARRRKSTDAEGRTVWIRLPLDELTREGKYTARPVEASGSLEDLEVPGLEGKFHDAVDLMRRIGRTDRARQSMIRHLFRFLMGRNEMLSDSKTLVEADRVYVQSEGSFRELLISLLSSDSFLYRR